MVLTMADTLQIRYPAGGVEAELAITDATIKAPDLQQFRVGTEPLATFDPGFMNTADTRSRSWPRSRPTSRWPTCCCTANCPTPRS